MEYHGRSGSVTHQIRSKKPLSVFAEISLQASYLTGCTGKKNLLFLIQKLPDPRKNITKITFYIFGTPHRFQFFFIPGKCMEHLKFLIHNNATDNTTLVQYTPSQKCKASTGTAFSANSILTTHCIGFRFR